ncbi:anaphase-promoting complex, cyclosome, subunit 4-domain-containing protein [Syncephalis fuscata]|nr:anaphase-promoting complex, cyclosome, subunit 4-domain-containing protein [Syncephalis fuscata]
MDRTDDVVFLVGSPPPDIDSDTEVGYESINDTLGVIGNDEEGRKVKRLRTTKGMSRSVKLPPPTNTSLLSTAVDTSGRMLLKAANPDTARHFHLYSERSLSDPILMASWCPTLDVLAMVHTRGDLVVSRISWSRVWSLPSESDKVQIACINWRPDGQILVAGYTDGTIKLFTIHNGKLIRELRPLDEATTTTVATTLDTYRSSSKPHSNRPSTSSVIGVYWAVKAVPKFKVNRNKLEMLDILRTQSLVSDWPSDRSEIIKDLAKKAKRNDMAAYFGWTTLPSDLDAYTPQPYSLLAIVDAGKFNIKMYYTSVLGVYMDNEALSYLLLLTTQVTESTRSIELQRFSLDCIGKYANELAMIEAMFTCTDTTLNEVKNICRSLKDAYHTYRRSIDEQVRVLASLLWRHGAFLYFMASFSFSDAFEQFFEQNLTEHSLKRWRSTGQKSLETMQTLIKQKLITMVDRLKITARRLETFALWNERYGPLGLSAAEIERSLKAIEEFMDQVKQLVENVDKELDCFNEFMTWIEYASTIMNMEKQHKEQRPIRVKQALVQTFLKESLAGEQYTKESGTDMDEDDDPFREIRRGTDQLYVFFHKIDENNNAKLTSGFDKVTRHMTEIFNLCSDAINSSIQLTSTLVIAQQDIKSNSLCTLRVIKDQTVKEDYACFVAYYNNSPTTTVFNRHHASTIDDAVWIIKIPCAHKLCPGVKTTTSNSILDAFASDLIIEDILNTTTSIQVARIPLSACVSDTATIVTDKQPRIRVLDMQFFDDETLCLRVELLKENYQERYLVTSYFLDLNYYSVSVADLPVKQWPHNILSSALDTVVSSYRWWIFVRSNESTQLVI